MSVQVREFFRVGPARHDHHPALRCAVGVGLPLLTLLALDRPDLAIFAVFGAFTGIYGRGERHRLRFTHQCQAGLMLVAAILAGSLGALAGLGPWGIVAGAAVIAGLSSLGTSFADLRPRGPIFQVFAFGAIASLPPPAPLWLCMLVAVLSVMLSLLIGLSSRIRPSHRTAWTPEPRRAVDRQTRRSNYAEASLYVVASGTAGAIANAAGLGHNYWAMVAATVPLVGPTATHRVGRGVHRILGTFAGLGLTVLLLGPGPPPWLIVLMIIALQFLAEMFITRHYSLAQLFVTPLALSMSQLVRQGDPRQLIADRAVETVIGAVVGIAVVLAVHQGMVLRQRRARAGRGR